MCLTVVRQRVSLQATSVRGGVAALRTSVDLLVGVTASYVPLRLYGVEREEGTEVTAELVGAGVAASLVSEEQGFVRAGKITL